MFDLFSEMMSYPFLVRAVVVGLLVSLCAALLGVNLVLKRFSMIGDGLSHVGFGAMAVATAVHIAPLYFSIPVVMLSAFLLLRVNSNSKLKGDSAIALISTSSLAIGVMVISISTGMNVDVCNYMFGSILAMSSEDVLLSIALSGCILFLYFLFYNRIFAVTFDEDFAKATGVNTNGYNILLAVLTSVTVVVGMRLMGALLISSLIIIPSLTAMRVFNDYKTVVISSVIISTFSFLSGITVSYLFSTPAGASVVCVSLVVFIGFSIVGWMIGRKKA